MARWISRLCALAVRFTRQRQAEFPPTTKQRLRIAANANPISQAQRITLVRRVRALSLPRLVSEPVCIGLPRRLQPSETGRLRAPMRDLRNLAQRVQP